MVQVDVEGIQSGEAKTSPETFRPIWMDIGGGEASVPGNNGGTCSSASAAAGPNGRGGAGAGAEATAAAEAEADGGAGKGMEEEIYLARVNWLQDGSLCAQVQNRAQTELRLLRLDAQTGAPTTLVVEKSRIWVNLHHLLRSLPAPALQVSWWWWC